MALVLCWGASIIIPTNLLLPMDLDFDVKPCLEEYGDSFGRTYQVKINSIPFGRPIKADMSSVKHTNTSLLRCYSNTDPV